MRFFAEGTAQRAQSNEMTPGLRKAVVWVLVPVITLVQWLIIQLCCQGLGSCLTVNPVYILIECSLLLTVSALLALCTGRWWIGCAVSSLFAFVYGVANHYVIDLHGTPLSLRDFGNIGVTGEVMKGYKLELSSTVLTQTVLFTVCLVCIFLLIFSETGKKRFELRGVIVRGAVLILSAVMVFFGLLSPNPIKPAQTRSWEWEPALRTYGCLSCLVENTLSANDIVIEPDGYSPERAAELAEKYRTEKTGDGVTPDVIFILNETWYDLSVITELKTDVDPFAALNERDDLVRGYAASPVIGGGTNCSEYELLTGNSLCLTPGITPFQSINMQGADGVVSRLEALGYTSLCANSESEGNYFRSTGYPGLGFDEIHFSDDFTDIEYYGDREYETDESLYRNLIGWYENMGDGPRFAYLLTIQNHGGYILNDESLDTVHVTEDYGNLNDELNEYLTCVDLSCRAFCDFVEYVESTGRPTVVCMVGDHTTFFAKQMLGEDVSGEQADLLLRTTPYVVWSNCDFDASSMPSTIALHSLSACVLNGAGIELCGYDSYVAEMCRSIPVVLSGGDWYDAQGVRHDSTEEKPELLGDYLTLLCSSITGGDEIPVGFFCLE